MTTEEIIRFVIDNFEGHSYTDDPIDTGGATKFGITLRTLQYYRRIMNGNPNLIITKNDVLNLTIDEAIKIGVSLFMIEPRFNQIQDWKLRLIVYDYAFHSGQLRAVRDLQKLLGGINIDGLIGPITLKAINGIGNPIMITFQLLTMREEFMQRIMIENSTQKRFIFGWWKRTTKLQRIISDLGE